MKKFLTWSPRILTIIFILFLSLFSLDAFSGGFGWEQLLGFVIHSIPSLILVGFLILAWKKPFVGGIIFLILGILFTIFFNTYREPLSFLFISGPVFLVGILFLLSAKK